MERKGDDDHVPAEKKHRPPDPLLAPEPSYQLVRKGLIAKLSRFEVKGKAVCNDGEQLVKSYLDKYLTKSWADSVWLITRALLRSALWPPAENKDFQWPNGEAVKRLLVSFEQADKKHDPEFRFARWHFGRQTGKTSTSFALMRALEMTGRWTKLFSESSLPQLGVDTERLPRAIQEHIQQRKGHLYFMPNQAPISNLSMENVQANMVHTNRLALIDGFYYEQTARLRIPVLVLAHPSSLPTCGYYPLDHVDPGLLHVPAPPAAAALGNVIAMADAMLQAIDD